MGDKTQVFPLESIESIRTRLTHSYEVANLARSLGVEIAESLRKQLPDDALRTIPAALAAVGLAHDIGNPPFGHQGENAIRSWFRRNSKCLFEAQDRSNNSLMADDIDKLTEQHKNDFLYFEGNAQTLRVLTKLQVIGDDLGLNLTLGTLASLMKYVAASNELDKNKQARKKIGYFTSEQSLVLKIREKTGLKNDARHPLALIMEACDDIAYSMLDAEDSIKKGLVSFNDLIAWVKRYSSDDLQVDPLIKYMCDISEWENKALAEQKLHPAELNDVATQKFRVHAIHVMVSAVAQAFKENYENILSGDFDGELIKISAASKLCSALKTFDRENAFNHRTVLEIELNGYNTINRLMDLLWIGITQREDYLKVGSTRTSPFAAYAYSRISKNYRRVFEDTIARYHPNEYLPVRYREMQLLTDMISGMTDRFCIDLCNDLNSHYTETQTVNETHS
jgi:dGTPase